eukprot:COSAG01_NODE_77165_length_169_cov_93.128571_1_plen_42_part_10
MLTSIRSLSGFRFRNVVRAAARVVRRRAAKRGQVADEHQVAV